MSNYYGSLDSYFLIASSAGVFVSFMLFLVGRAKLRHWHTYSVIANSFALYVVILSMQYGENPRALIDMACFSSTMFLILTSFNSDESKKPLSSKATVTSGVTSAAQSSDHSV